MKKLYLILFFCFAITQAFAQYVLETPDGKKVKLKPDGTWEFVKQDATKSKSNEVPKASTEKYTGIYKRFAVWFDPAQWTYETNKTPDGLSWDVTFYSADRAVSGYGLESRLALPMTNVDSTVRSYWQNTGTIVSLTTFKDSVNGIPGYGFSMLLEYSSLIYQYKGFIYSGAKGSFQFVVGTQQQVFEEDKNKIDLLFKGITML